MNSMNLLYKLLIFMTLFGASSSYAWREMAHKTICQIAYNHLDPKIKTIIDEFYPGSNFGEECLFADYVRTLEMPGATAKQKEIYLKTSNWHFVPLDLNQDYLLQDTYPPTQQGDSIYGINTSLINIQKTFLHSRLKRSPSKTEQKAYYDKIRYELRIFMHLLSDLHQPLHAGSHDRRGGNRTGAILKMGDLKPESNYDYQNYILNMEGAKSPILSDEIPREEVSLNLYGPDKKLKIYSKSDSVKPISLHMVWDQHLLDYFCKSKLQLESCDSTLKEEAATNYTHFLEEHFSSPSEKELAPFYGLWAYGWWMESKRLLDKIEPTQDSLEPVLIDNDYYNMGIQITHQRVYIAGRRLAHILNSLFLELKSPALKEASREIDYLKTLNLQKKNFVSLSQVYIGDFYNNHCITPGFKRKQPETPRVKQICRILNSFKESEDQIFNRPSSIKYIIETQKAFSPEKNGQ